MQLEFTNLKEEFLRKDLQAKIPKDNKIEGSYGKHPKPAQLWRRGRSEGLAWKLVLMRFTCKLPKTLMGRVPY